jgi:hypothetical protein
LFFDPNHIESNFVYNDHPKDPKNWSLLRVIVVRR